MKATPNTRELARKLKAVIKEKRVDYLVFRQEINTRGEHHTLGNITVSRFTI